MVTIPAALARNAVAAWGEAGRRWLDALPATVAAVAADWHLDIGEPYALTFHWVVQARRADGTLAVLKLGPPRLQPLEATVLRCYDGAGAVRLLAHDPDRGAMLLERAVPGTMVRRLVPERDMIATAAIITVMRRLHRAVPDASVPDLVGRDRPSLMDHLQTHDGDGRIPRRLVTRALGLLGELSDRAPSRVLLHGDLHHDNVLRAQREPWLAIDPHGVSGDPGFEVGPMLYNPDPDRRDPALVALVPSRIEQLADGLGMSEDRVAAWGFVASVISEVWTAEDRTAPVTRALDVALALSHRVG